MTKMGFEDGALFELRFWLPVLGDHARFIRDGLAPGELRKYPERSSSFKPLISSRIQRR